MASEELHYNPNAPERTPKLGGNCNAIEDILLHIADEHVDVCVRLAQMPTLSSWEGPVSCFMKAALSHQASNAA